MAARSRGTRYPDKFAMLTRPEPAYHGVIYTEHYGRAAYAAHCRTVCLRNTGAVLPPLSAFLLLQGIETMALRVERHVENARKVADYLRKHPRVAWVSYAGFPDSPYYALAQKYLGGNAPSLLTFGVKGGYEAGRKIINALNLFKRLVNMGDAKSLATHPASTTHRQLTEAELAQAGVKPEMIRLSVGIEHIDDIHRRSRSGIGGGLMPVLIERRRKPRKLGVDWALNRIDIGLVNNMPDTALEATERQFVALLEEAAQDVQVHLHLYQPAGNPARRPRRAAHEEALPPCRRAVSHPARRDDRHGRRAPGAAICARSRIGAA